MNQVLQIQLSESVKLDKERLGALYSQLGEASAEDVVCRALEELALRMSQCNKFYNEKNFNELRKNARTLIAIADQLGFHTFSRVAGDVTQCIDADDTTALAATLSRLLRIGERSLTAIWDLQNVTI